MPNVEFILTGKEDSKLVDVINKQERAINKLQSEIDKVGKGGVQSFGGIEKEIKKVTSTLAGQAGLAGAVAVVVDQLKAAYDLMKRNKEEANRTFIDVGHARAAAMINLPNTFEGGKDAYDFLIKKIAKESGLGIAQTYQASGPALSAKGSASSKEFEQSLLLGGKLEAATGGGIKAGDIATSLLMTQTATGNKNAMANLGWIRQAGAAALINTFQGQLRMIPPINAAMKLGDTPEQAMEMQALVSQLTGDTTGERTATGFSNLITNLKQKDLVPSYKINKSGKKELKFKPLTGKNTRERIAELQKYYAEASPELRNEIEKNLGGEANMQGFILGMLNNDESYRGNLKEIESQIRMPDASSEKEAEEFLKDTLSGTAGTVVKSDIATKQKVEEIQINNPQRALEQQAKEKYYKTLEAYGYSTMRTMPEWLNYAVNAGGMPFGGGSNFAETLANRVDVLKTSPFASEKDLTMLDELKKSLDELSANIKNLNKTQNGENKPSSQEID